ncbi:DUF309 domain-containing protein [Paenibacillus sp. N1-5-1-14]|uniref:DUF309 domain-containing protein n=1 Tax=Paenibacillus radicibacter TaxID=2972488 RepID=UPI002159A04E|nr:DUF309 domain-containing protein [Paenibacillus radicibacter]MCR8641636.1 DUF309 domain-containing protein [Paenibacillus radicibacter]
MEYPQAYIDYLVFFHADRDYFECHEVLEEYWKEHPRDPFAQTWVGLIQIAVGLYHHRRGNLAGARKMLGSSLLRLHGEHVQQLGLDMGELTKRISTITDRLQVSDLVEYEDIELPIADQLLLDLCKRECQAHHKVWGNPSLMTDSSLIHKHTLRDRSGVIAERQKQALLKRKPRETDSPFI